MDNFTNDEISAGGKVACQAFDGQFSRGNVKINHHIPAKDNILIVGDWIFILEEIDAFELNFFAQLGLDSAFPFLGVNAFLEVALEDVCRNRFDNFHAVDALFGSFQNGF